MKKILAYVTAMMMLCAISGFAATNEYGHDEAKSWGKKEMDKKMMMGKHAMSGTVESVDLKTGWIKVKTAEGDMTVHFPAQSIKDLKNGDMITVHLGFSKGEEMMEEKMKGGKMMEEKKK